MSPEELDRFCEWLAPKLMRGGNGWQRRFAFSIKMQAARPSWKPSAKQERVMRELMAEFDGDDGGVIEHG